MKPISRRSFLADAVAAGAMMAGWSAAGCAPSQTSSTASSDASGAASSSKAAAPAQSAGSASAASSASGSASAASVAGLAFDLAKHTVMLKNGVEMPVLGLGTYILSSAQAEESVYAALMAGTRLIDTARIVTPEGKAIYVDPYAGEDACYDLPADLILVTHAHFDHNGLERVASRNTGCRVITQADAVANGKHRAFELGFATVVPVQAGFNALHDVRDCVGYVIELSDGTSVYLTGDTSTTDDMRDGTLAAMHIDYAFWCTDGVYNMGNEEAAEAARMAGATHSIPYHNDTSNSGDMFDREAAEKFAAPNTMVVLPGEEVSL